MCLSQGHINIKYQSRIQIGLSDFKACIYIVCCSHVDVLGKNITQLFFHCRINSVHRIHIHINTHTTHQHFFFCFVFVHALFLPTFDLKSYWFITVSTNSSWQTVPDSNLGDVNSDFSSLRKSVMYSKNGFSISRIKREGLNDPSSK